MIIRGNSDKMDNRKVEIKRTKNRGYGVFAKLPIKKSEVVAEFDGDILSIEDDWTIDQYNHCIQFEETRWRDSRGLARIINHSCEPNCGIKKLFQVVAMRNISPNEEITWDYEMTENHPYWKMKCKCGTKSCRKVIGNYENMPEETRKKYKGYISSWLIKKFKK